MIFSKYFFDLLFHCQGIYYGQMYPKTCFGILISPPEPKKAAKKLIFEKWKNYSFSTKIGAFSAKMWSKTMYYDVFEYHAVDV